MNSAILENGTLVTAKEYEPHRHGSTLYCMDRSCRVPVHFVTGDVQNSPHFKTSGKGNSVHNPTCGFAKKLTFQEALAKVGDYQSDIREQGLREFVVKFNMDKLDPDYIPKHIERGEGSPEKAEPKLAKSQQPDSTKIASLLQNLKEIDWSSNGDLKYLKGLSGANILAGDILNCTKR